MVLHMHLGAAHSLLASVSTSATYRMISKILLLLQWSAVNYNTATTKDHIKSQTLSYTIRLFRVNFQ